MFVSVDTQCRDRFFYSKARAKEAEDYFGQIETLYSRCVTKIKAGSAERPTSQEYFGLVLMVFDLHLRNKAQQNLTGQSNLEAYRTSLFCLLRDVLLSKGEGIPEESEFKSHLNENWRVRIITPTTDSEFITSDNPTMLFSTNARRDYHFAVLPVAPDHLVVAFDKRFVGIRSEHTTRADDAVLNKQQCCQAIAAIYSRTRLDKEQETTVGKLLREPRSHGVTRLSSIEITGLAMTPGTALSFVLARRN